MPEILHMTEVTPRANYRLFVRFNNGDAGEVDLSSELDGKVFGRLRDPAQFATAYLHPVMRTVAWANKTTKTTKTYLAPVLLLELMRQQQVQALLVNIAGADNKGTPKACVELREAIDDYKNRLYIVSQDARGRKFRTRPGISETRKYLTDLETKLRAARNLADAMLPSAMSLFCDAYGQPRGKLLNEFDDAIHAVEKSLKVARHRAHREKNYDLSILAYKVAVVMQDFLGITPTSTRDTAQNVNFTKGGAAYARLLREVLDLAGFDVRSIRRKHRGLGDKDIGPLIDEGLRLLKDPSSPHNYPTGDLPVA
jgi:hypothetical protein